MNSQPMRNSYLRSEIVAFLRTLSTVANNSPDDRYRIGWLDALGALAMLVNVEPDTLINRTNQEDRNER